MTADHHQPRDRSTLYIDRTRLFPRSAKTERGPSRGTPCRGNTGLGRRVSSGRIRSNYVWREPARGKRWRLEAATTAALAAGLKYLAGWQKHEQNVANGKSPAIRQAPVAKPASATRRTVAG